MSAELSPADKGLLEAISRADVMDAAGRLIANPRRAVISLAEQVAMAIAIEQLQGVAIEAELLVRALEMPDTGNDHDDALKDHAVQTQTACIRSLIAAARGEANRDQQETAHDQ